MIDREKSCLVVISHSHMPKLKPQHKPRSTHPAHTRRHPSFSDLSFNPIPKLRSAPTNRDRVRAKQLIIILQLSPPPPAAHSAPSLSIARIIADWPIVHSSVALGHHFAHLLSDSCRSFSDQVIILRPLKQLAFVPTYSLRSSRQSVGSAGFELLGLVDLLVTSEDEQAPAFDRPGPGPGRPI